MRSLKNNVYSTSKNEKSANTGHFWMVSLSHEQWISPNYLSFKREQYRKKNEKRLQCNLRQRQVKIEKNYLFKLIKNMETSLKTGLTQIFSSCLKNLSCPKIRRGEWGGGGRGARPMLRTDENLRALSICQNWPARPFQSWWEFHF